MAEPTVLQTFEEGVSTIVLNRPQALNCLTASMHEALLRALNGAASDRRVRCVVLTGAGRSFCTGQDLSDVRGDLGELLTQYYHPLIKRLHSMPVPVLAAVKGVAAGAGASIALACDVVIAAHSSSFMFPFAKIGLVPDAGAAWLLPRLVGRARAMGLCMLADKLDAIEAEAMGLIWRAVEVDAFDIEIQEAAQRLACMSTSALIATRQLLDDGASLTLNDSLEREVIAQRTQGQSADYAEGLAAFMTKRAPTFQERQT